MSQPTVIPPKLHMARQKGRKNPSVNKNQLKNDIPDSQTLHLNVLRLWTLHRIKTSYFEFAARLKLYVYHS